MLLPGSDTFTSWSLCDHAVSNCCSAKWILHSLSAFTEKPCQQHDNYLQCTRLIHVTLLNTSCPQCYARSRLMWKSQCSNCKPYILLRFWPQKISTYLLHQSWYMTANFYNWWCCSGISQTWWNATLRREQQHTYQLVYRGVISCWRQCQTYPGRACGHWRFSWQHTTCTQTHQWLTPKSIKLWIGKLRYAVPWCTLSTARSKDAAFSRTFQQAHPDVAIPCRQVAQHHSLWKVP